MAPSTYVRFALSVAPSGHIYFRSLEFIDINGLAPIDGLLPCQALRFEDLYFVVDCLGWLRLREENVAPPHISTPNHGPSQAGPMIINFDLLPCRVNAYLGAHPEPELSRCVFYMLANAFAWLSGGGPLPLEAVFWNPSTPLPSDR